MITLALETLEVLEKLRRERQEKITPAPPGTISLSATGFAYRHEGGGRACFCPGRQHMHALSLTLDTSVPEVPDLLVLIERILFIGRTVEGGEGFIEAVREKIWAAVVLDKVSCCCHYRPIGLD